MTSPDRPVRAELTPGEVDALAFQAVVVLGTVPDLLVTLVRFARRDRGIQLGPTLATLAVAAATPRAGRWAIRAEGRGGVAARTGLMAAILVLPAAAGGARSTVVGAGSPLWQLAAAAAVRVVSGLVTVLPVALAAGRRRSSAAADAATVPR